MAGFTLNISTPLDPGIPNGFVGVQSGPYRLVAINASRLQGEFGSSYQSYFGNIEIGKAF